MRQGQPSNRHFGCLGQKNCNNIPPVKSQINQAIGELICIVTNLMIAVAGDFAIKRLVDQRNFFWIICMSITDVIGDVVVFRDVPAEIVVDLFVSVALWYQHGHPQLSLSSRSES
jgi:hypothetical protein